ARTRPARHRTGFKPGRQERKVASATIAVPARSSSAPPPAPSPSAAARMRGFASALFPAGGLLGLARGLPFGLRPRPLALLGLPPADLGDPLGDGDLETLLRSGGVVEARHRHAPELAADCPLDGGEQLLFGRRNEGVSIARGLGAGRPADAMDVILRLVRHVE